MSNRSTLSWLILGIVVSATLAFLLLQRGPTADTVFTHSATVSLGTDQASYAPGEPVVMTFTNRGTTVLGLPADPPYVVHQGTTTIYHPIVAIPQLGQSSVINLNPGMSQRWRWDQFTLDGLVAPGTYDLVVTYLIDEKPETIQASMTIGE